MSQEVQLSPEAMQQAERVAAAARLEEAYLDGRQSEINAAHAEIARLTTPVIESVPNTVTVLPRATAPRAREFTGAARRIAQTGGRLPQDGGAHRHQRLYR